MHSHRAFINVSGLLIMLLLLRGDVQAYYTTQGQNIIEIETGAVVQLRGIGLGGWLLPEGYMWGIRKLDRPRQFEAAIEDLIGPRNARKFWDLYYSNFVTREDIVRMKSWGVNTLRVPILASMLQPREGQPQQAPFVYDEHNFGFVDAFVDWCEELGMGVIWDLHGAPGGQNAENIADSDGEARLWTEKAIYWPQTIDLWDTITRRYAHKQCIVGYDLLNEPLLTRYPGVDPGMLRELYVLLTETIRKTDTEGIIFIEGDDWAQNFSLLEPMDWDPHLVLAFHSYPPSRSQNGIQRWDDLRQKYNMPLWHGETGEQEPPWELYKRSTRFLQEANIGWNWWTHKKFELSRQPWRINRTEGFDKILAYWNGRGEKPGQRQAKKWLFEQAKLTNSMACQFLPGMVASLIPLDPSEDVRQLGIQPVKIRQQPRDTVLEEGYAASLRVVAQGLPLEYQWYRNQQTIPQATGFSLQLNQLPAGEREGNFSVEVYNQAGRERSKGCSVTLKPFQGHSIPQTETPPAIDGFIDERWSATPHLMLEQVVMGERSSLADLSAWYALLWDAVQLYILVDVTDDSLSTSAIVDYMRDGVEFYIDADNSKSSYYDDDDYQLRLILDDATLSSSIGEQVEGVICSQQHREGGYTMEVSIPWASLGEAAQPGAFLGIEVHVNDSDSSTRNAKLTWWTPRDNAYQTPSVFGTVRLIK